MGGYFIYNRSIDTDEAMVRRVFSDRGLSRCIIRDAGDVRMMYFPKIQNGECGFIADDSGVCFSVGAFGYRGLDRYAGLRCARHDIENNALDATCTLGAFHLVTGDEKTVQIHCDAAGLYHGFYRTDGHAVSSSFRAVLNSIKEDQVLDRMTVIMNLILGFWPQNRTFSNRILRLTPDTADQVSLSFPCEIRFLPKPERSPHRYRSVAACTRAEIENLDNVFREYRALCPDGACLGLSGGFDSRLAALMLRRHRIDWDAFTHWKPGAGTDQAVAETVALHMDVPLTVIDTSEKNRPDSMEKPRILDQAFRFFDGRIHHAMEYLKHEYTVNYRFQVHPDARPVISGTGGEIFRNHNYIPLHGTVGFNAWLWYYVADYLSYSSIKTRSDRNQITDRMRRWLVDAIGIKDGDRVPSTNIRKFYPDVWVPQWFGLRFSVENQFSLYFAPFTDPRVTVSVDAIGSRIGWHNALETQMIQSLNPAVAALPTSYGYPCDRIPVRHRFHAMVRCRTPSALKLCAGYRREMRRQSKPLAQHPDVQCQPALIRAVRNMYDLDLPLNLDILARSREKKVMILSMGYALEQHMNESTLRCGQV